MLRFTTDFSLSLEGAVIVIVVVPVRRGVFSLELKAKLFPIGFAFIVDCRWGANEERETTLNGIFMRIRQVKI